MGPYALCRPQRGAHGCLGAAAARGWRLADVRAAVASGAWKGFPGLYTGPRNRAGWTGSSLEWRKSVDFTAGEKIYVTGSLATLTTRPPAPTDGADEFGLIRQWATGTDCAVADPERARRWGRRAVAVRQLLAAIGQAAMVSGSAVLEFGTRNLALHSGLSQRTVSRLLALLYAEPDPLLDVVNRGRMARADRIALRIPDAYADSVRWRRRRAGRIDAIHPAFLVLGGAAALTYQALDADEVRGAEVARAARLCPRPSHLLCGYSLSTGSPNAARVAGGAGPSAWTTSPSRPARPTFSGSARRGTGRIGRAGGPGCGSTPAPVTPS